MTSALNDIAARLRADEPLTERDGQELLSTQDLLAIGMLADDARRARHGDRVTFGRVHMVAIDPHAQGLTEPLPPDAGEYRLIASSHDLAAVVAGVRSLASAAGRVPVAGCSLADLESTATADRVPLSDVLARLRDAGLDIIADAPIDALNDPERAFEAAAAAGLSVPCLTVHRLTGQDRVPLVMRAVSLQHSVGMLRAFAPIPRMPDAHPSTGYDDVKQVAVARLLAGNIGSIQVDWALSGAKLSQVALTFGADDIDAVPAVDPENLGIRRSVLEEVRRNIRAASLMPAERNGRFEIFAS